MSKPTRDDLNAALDAIDQLTNQRGVDKLDAKAKADVLAQAKLDSDAAAVKYIADGQAVADAVASYQQMVLDYTADTDTAAARGSRSTPSVRR